jgi:hypothetical protein
MTGQPWGCLDKLRALPILAFHAGTAAHEAGHEECGIDPSKGAFEWWRIVKISGTTSVPLLASPSMSLLRQHPKRSVMGIAAASGAFDATRSNGRSQSSEACTSIILLTITPAKNVRMPERPT